MLKKSLASPQIIPVYIEIGDVQINCKNLLLGISIYDQLKFAKEFEILYNWKQQQGR